MPVIASFWDYTGGKKGSAGWLRFNAVSFLVAKPSLGKVFDKTSDCDGIKCAHMYTWEVQFRAVDSQVRVHAYPAITTYHKNCDSCWETRVMEKIINSD